MLQGRSIICFAPSDYWGMNPSCTTHIMQGLARRNKVLYINPFSSDLLGGGTSKGIGVRIARKIKSIAKCLQHPQAGLYVFSPVFLPLQGRWAIDKLNNILLKLQIKVVCRRIGIKRPVLWLENVRAADMLDWFDATFMLYHVSDRFADCSYTSNSDLQHRREQIISRRSDALICVSERLYAAKAAEREGVFYLPHGVDFELFRAAAEQNKSVSEQDDACTKQNESPAKQNNTETKQNDTLVEQNNIQGALNDTPAELANVPRPIAGYFGTMTQHNDLELLEYCARNLPDVSFVLAGQVTSGDYDKLAELPNVFLLGRVAYENIPRLCSGFDVCMLQWKMSEWIRSCNPLKLLEYMASGRPIVSVAIDEVNNKYADVVSVAQNKEQFCTLIRHELQNDTDERAARRIEIAREHSWTRHIERISQIIGDIERSVNKGPE